MYKVAQHHFVLLLLLLLLVVAQPSITPAHGQLLEACCCSKEYVDATFTELRAVLDSLVQQPYFRYFKANLERACPYWAVQVMCSGAPAPGAPPPCHVCVCDANEVPIAVRQESTCLIDSILREGQWDNTSLVLEVDRTTQASLLPWADASEWFFHDYTDPDMVYVDLVRNPEGNTGYVGVEAQRVWHAVYQENCFHGEVAAMCLEERVFYRLLSGLQASISTHIAAHFTPDSPAEGEAGDATGGYRPQRYLPNWPELERRVVAHPERVDNLYYIFMFVLRAVVKAKPILLRMQSFTGDLAADAATRDGLRQLYATPLACTPTFNESLLFQESARPAQLLRQMRNNLRNITRLMDCLTCEKCRLWGKLQTLGLATALKLVVSDRHAALDVPPVVVTRSELVALVNLLRQLSVSLHNVQLYTELRRTHSLPQPNTNPFEFPWT